MQFVGVYIREAHAADGAWPQASGQAACDVLQPKTIEERFAVAKRCNQALNMTLPLLVDGIDDRVGHAYSGMPDRLYVIDKQGRVAYKGGRGPFGYRPGEMEQSLITVLLEQGWDPAEFSRQALAGDTNGDGKLSKTEARGSIHSHILLPNFEQFDIDKNGLLDSEEIKKAALWLNTKLPQEIKEKPQK